MQNKYMAGAVSLILVSGTAYAETSQSDSSGFLAGSSLSIFERNYYFNRNFVNHTGTKNYIEEWANGISGNFVSGFTQGTVGFGLDASAYWGLKLDSGGGTNNSDLLPIGRDKKADDSYSKLNAAVKMRVSNTVLKYGNLQPANPVFNTSDTRLFPQSYTGFQTLSTDIKDVKLDGGYFTSANARASQDHDGEIGTGYSNVAAKSAKYLGGTYTYGGKNLSTSVYASNLEDIWNQYYFDTTYIHAFNSQLSLTSKFNLYHTVSDGKEKSGAINNTAWSLFETLAVGPHTFGIAYQKVHGDEDFDHQGNAGQNGVLWIANTVQIYDFNGPNEQSAQFKYTYDFSAMGIPGLTFMGRYIKGWDIDGSNANSHYANRYGNNEKHWERDLELRYVVQSGKAKDLNFWLRYASHRGSSNRAFSDIDEVRFITQYPLNIF